MIAPRRRTLVALGLAALLAVAVTLALLTTHHSTRRTATLRDSGAPTATTPTGAPSPTGGSTSTAPSQVGTTSADVYAAQLAKALWTVRFATETRNQAQQFWHSQLADVLPAGTPAGTTVAQAQQAALQTLDTRLPSAATWQTLAASDTRSSFAVTSVSEPSSWVSAVASGQIVDPGLTARTVLGVQTVTYGVPTHTTRETQQLTLVMLCPPTTRVCRLEIIPPDGAGGS